MWLLLFAMLAFRFGHGLYFPFSSIYFHNVLGIPLSLVGIGLAVFAAASVLSGIVGTLFGGATSFGFGVSQISDFGMRGCATFWRIVGFFGLPRPVK